MKFGFKIWRDFHVEKDQKVITRFLRGAAEESEKAFKKGMASKKSGRLYWRRGRQHRSSAPGEYPAIETGNLLHSLETRVYPMHFEIGTDMFYSKFLRYGTRIMARRKMSDNALKEGVPKARHLLKGWVKWKR